MKWERARKSRNVEDRRGRRVAAGGGLGLGGIAIVVVISLLLGQNPLELIGLESETQPGANAPSTTPSESTDEDSQFVAAILGETEDVRSNLFETRGATYPVPTLVLFTAQVRSACGSASSAMARSIAPAIARSTSICPFLRK